MVAIIIAVIVDNSIVGIATSSGGMRSSFSDIVVFAVMVLVFAIGQYIILGFVRSKYLHRHNETAIIRSHIYRIDRITTFLQYALVAVLVSVIFQIAFISSYHIYSLILVILFSYGLSILLLSLLAKHFFSWYRLNRSFVILFYGLAMSFITINGIITIIYLDVGFTDNPAFIKSARSLTGSFANPNAALGLAYSLTTITFFVLTWIATVLLLGHYSRKLGKIKYWILVSIPLAYFLSQFQPLFLFTFANYRLSDPVLFGMVYTLIFSISKPLGGVLSFWMISRNLKNNKVKGYLIISAYGMTLLFASNQPTSLILVPYPPFGLVTVCFIGLSSYLLYLGIQSSAFSVSEDSRLRQSIRKEAFKESQRFLDVIGTAEMEREVQQKVLEFSKNEKDLMENETGISTSIDDEDVKRYLDEVLV
ncbi:MAG TPA: hypothetical protein VE130_01800, partial [Nitrososphaeraceae archaeon]|nr:hypothetical protein [Nitrososphaeraceae archaeon]